jgi:hypothetical protein
VLRRFRETSKARTNGVQIDVGHAFEKCGVIEQRLKLEPAFPESTVTVVFAICSAGERLVYAAHEPTDAHKASSPAGNFCRCRAIFRNGEQLTPSPHGVGIRPLRGLFGFHSQYYVIVVMHDCISNYFNREDRRKLHQATFDPLSAVAEVLARIPILPAKERTPHASRHAVVVTGLFQANLLRSRYRHRKIPP